MDGSPLTDLGALINRYFAWMAAGPPWRYFLGIGGPVFVLLVFYLLVLGGGGNKPLELDVVAATATAGKAASSQSSAAATNANSATSTSAGGSAVSATGTPRVTATPAATVVPGGTYVVKSGDTLGAICAANVPSLSTNACVSAILQLNKLTDAGSLQIGQQLTMPGGTPAAGSTPAAATTPAAPTATPRP